MYKSRYPRQALYGRRKTRKKRGRIGKDSAGILKKVMVQIVFCIIIIAVSVVIKNFDTPVTNYLENRIKSVLANNMEIKDAAGYIGKLFKDAQKEEYSATGEKDKESPDVSKNALGKDGKETEDKVENHDAVSDAESIPLNSIAQEDASRVEGINFNSSTDNEKCSFMIPVGGIIGSTFGERVHPISGEREFHKGIDIEARSGTAIKAAYDGQVLEANEESTYGKYIKIRHEGDVTSLYAHCSVLYVKAGQNIRKGDVIAEVGNTGLSEGAHLHFEVRKGENAVNPLDYIGLSPN
jgi:murein DD-endopeptidase MepM/ murein hydrolase activator NlpD